MTESRYRMGDRDVSDLLWTLGLIVLVGLGCEPRYGRIDPSVTTDAELKSSRVLPTALMEFSEQVPRELVRDLSDLPMIRDLPKPVTVIMGDLNNQTRSVTSDEFELVRSRIRNNLLQSPFVRDQIRFTESRHRMDYLRERELGQSPNTGPQLDPTTTFALNGDFFHIHRENVNQYYMEFQLVSFANNEIVFSQRYDVKQVRP